MLLCNSTSAFTVGLLTGGASGLCSWVPRETWRYCGKSRTKIEVPAVAAFCVICSWYVAFQLEYVLLCADRTQELDVRWSAWWGSDGFVSVWARVQRWGLMTSCVHLCFLRRWVGAYSFTILHDINMMLQITWNLFGMYFLSVVIVSPSVSNYF